MVRYLNVVDISTSNFSRNGAFVVYLTMLHLAIEIFVIHEIRTVLITISPRLENVHEQKLQ